MSACRKCQVWIWPRKLLDIDPTVLIIVASGYYLDLTLQKWGPNVRAIVKPFEAADIDVLIAESCARLAAPAIDAGGGAGIADSVAEVQEGRVAARRRGIDRQSPLIREPRKIVRTARLGPRPR